MTSATQISELRRAFLSRAHGDIQALHERLERACDNETSHELVTDIAQLSHRLMGSYGSFGFPAMARNFELIEEVALSHISAQSAPGHGPDPTARADRGHDAASEPSGYFGL